MRIITPLQPNEK